MIYEKKLEGYTVRLRSVREEDAEITYKMRSDPKKSKYIHEIQGGVEAQRRYIHEQRKKEGDYLFLVEDIHGTPVGMKGLYNYDPVKKTIESGRFIGFGNAMENMEALHLSFCFAFHELNVEKIYMSVLEDNKVMYGIQQKLGVRVYEKKYNKEFGCADINSVLSKEVYSLSGAKIEALIKRFSERRKNEFK